MKRALALLLLCLALPLPLPSWAAGEAVAYTAIEIARPEAEETIHDNAGTVEVALSLSPPLQAEFGHRVKVFLDGVALPETRTESGFTLTEIDRGAHTLQAAVVDSAGHALITSAPVTFYMWRASALFRRH